MKNFLTCGKGQQNIAFIYLGPSIDTKKQFLNFGYVK